MLPFILAAVGGYLIGDSFGKEIDYKIPKFAEGGVPSGAGMFSFGEWELMPNNRYYRKFLISKEDAKSGKYRDITDFGVVESMEETNDGFYVVILSVTEAGKEYFNKNAKFADGGTIGDEGFTITEMKELLNAKFPYSFGFRVFPLKKNTNCQPDYDYGGSALYGIDNQMEFKEKLYFPQYKRDHAINYEISQGGENTYFYFLLESENGDGYSGTFGFKDRGDVGKEYVTGFLAFLQEQYGLPFQIEHKVMANGGMMMADGGKEYAKGGIFFTNKRNLSRDRMFKSQQSWEQKYKRKSKPRNPHYN